MSNRRTNTSSSSCFAVTSLVLSMSPDPSPSQLQFVCILLWSWLSILRTQWLSITKHLEYIDKKLSYQHCEHAWNLQVSPLALPSTMIRKLLSFLHKETCLRRHPYDYNIGDDRL